MAVWSRSQIVSPGRVTLTGPPTTLLVTISAFRLYTPVLIPLLLLLRLNFSGFICDKIHL